LNASRKWIAVAVVICSAIVAAPSYADEAARKAAVKESRSWLALVDGQRYGESWQRAAALLRAAVTRAEFERAVSAVRKPLGRVVSRRLRGTHYATSLPGAPDGEYVVIQYDSVFENKKAAVEPVTPMKERDGLWKVSGYYIR
jgi:hypothetical protein